MVKASEVGADLDYGPEETYRIVHFLERCGYLDYLGAGPSVCITRLGIEYLDRGRGRRRSVRDAG